MQYEVIFDLGCRSYLIESKNKKEARDAAVLELWNEIKHNPEGFIQSVVIDRRA